MTATYCEVHQGWFNGPCMMCTINNVHAKPDSYTLPISFAPYQSSSLEDQGRKAWRNLHVYDGNDAKWFEKWEANDIPSSCSCRANYRKVRENWSPDFTSRQTTFASGCELHNLINAELGKDQMRIGCAIQTWRPHWWFDKQQEQLEGVVAVTSLSLLPKHLEVQQRSIDSWRLAGLDVIAGNSAEQIERLRAIYDVEFREVRNSPIYDRPSSLIIDLLRVEKSRDVLLINSDIQIYGGNGLIRNHVLERQCFAGIRRNYGLHPGDNDLETWGFDAFLLTQSAIATLPDLDFALGQPMWDYWLPYHMDVNAIPYEVIGSPFFYHSAHPIHWTPELHLMGRDIMREVYGIEQDAWSRWRHSKPFSEASQ